MSEQKTYLDGFIIKEKTFSNGNTILNIAINAEQLVRFVNEHADERGWLRIGISKRLKPSEKGVTHCAWLDTWKPNQDRNPPTARTHEQQPQNYDAHTNPTYERTQKPQQPTSTDNLPF